MRLEHELLLLCARTQVDEKTRQRLNVITSPPAEIDWDYFHRLARRHSVLPLIYSQLSKLNSLNIPSSELDRLRKNYQNNAARNLLLSAELCKILQQLESAGIEAVPYKGPALAVYAYGNVALRRFVDLDILVRKGDVLQALKILEGAGFVCPTPWTSAQRTLLLRTQHNLSMSRESGLLVVELHWEVASRLFARSLQAEDVWGRLASMRLNNLEVKCLAAEDLVLSLCVHGSKHLWERLAWICDVAELIRTRKEIDWDTLLARAVSAGSQRMLLLGLHLANSLLDAPRPAQIEERLKADPTVARLAREASQRLFVSADPLAITIFESFSFNWAVRSDLRSKLRYCRLLLQPTDADIETRPLPRALTFIYYLRRPFALLRRDRERRHASGNAKER
ncbi:MAG TPA: nucleotidyltransferase family protein [Pyrinomonadaceae bacterium]|nr:nucleotidyltransferase family protein [Pyrinomonadaceae bacterium]